MAFDWLRRRRAKAAHSRRSPAEQQLDALLTRRIAIHFPDARVDGTTVDTGMAGLRIVCRTGALSEGFDGETAVPVFVWLSGGALGARHRFASMNGHGLTAEEAVVDGAGGWIHTFFPVLRQSLTGSPEPDVTTFDVARDGRRYLAVVAKGDRAWTFSRGDTPAASGDGLFERARDLLGGTPMLTPRIMASGTLPPFTEQHTLVSVFVMLAPDQVTYEVKVNGHDWEPDCVRAQPADGVPGALLLLRELAVLTLLPDDAPTADGSPLSRDEVEAGLKALGRRTAPGAAAGWPGWRRQGGFAGTPLTADAVSALERRTGPLPADYRRFLTEVAGPGAGPGYGLCEPVRVGDRLVVAHAGCYATWVVRLDEPHRGQVWLDAHREQPCLVPVAPSFTMWLRRWFDEARTDRPWVQWDLSGCPVGPAMNRNVRTLREKHPGATVAMNRVAHVGGGSPYLPGGTLDPCQGCADASYRLAGRDLEFVPGPLAKRG